MFKRFIVNVLLELSVHELTESIDIKLNLN